MAPNAPGRGSRGPRKGAGGRRNLAVAAQRESALGVRLGRQRTLIAPGGAMQLGAAAPPAPRGRGGGGGGGGGRGRAQEIRRPSFLRDTVLTVVYLQAALGPLRRHLLAVAVAVAVVLPTIFSPCAPAYANSSCVSLCRSYHSYRCFVPQFVSPVSFVSP